MLVRLMYASRAAQGLKPEALSAILKRSTSHNPSDVVPPQKSDSAMIVCTFVSRVIRIPLPVAAIISSTDVGPPVILNAPLLFNGSDRLRVDSAYCRGYDSSFRTPASIHFTARYGKVSNANGTKGASGSAGSAEIVIRASSTRLPMRDEPPP